MKKLKQWFPEQWNDKKFRGLIIAAPVITIALCSEFFPFGYAILKSIRYVSLLWGLFVIAWIDGKSRRIPNEILMALFLFRGVLLIAECVTYRGDWLTIIFSAATGFLLGGGMFLLCYLLTRGGIGAGDVKLFAVLGFYLGRAAVFSTAFLTVVYAALYSTINLIRGKTSLEKEIAFAPFLLIGTIMAMILGI